MWFAHQLPTAAPETLPIKLEHQYAVANILLAEKKNCSPEQYVLSQSLCYIPGLGHMASAIRCGAHTHTDVFFFMIDGVVKSPELLGGKEPHLPGLV